MLTSGMKRLQTSHGTLDRRTVIEAMAMAAWYSTGENHAWEELPYVARHDWMALQEAALIALEQSAPEVRTLFAE